jgi:uncharacterized membrane protein
MDAETPVVNPADERGDHTDRVDITDEIVEMPEQPTFVTSGPYPAQPPVSDGDEDDTEDDDIVDEVEAEEDEANAVTQADLQTPPAAYGHARPRVPREMLSGGASPDEDERPTLSRSQGPVGRSAPMRRPSGGPPPRMPRGWQPVAPPQSARPRGYPTPRLAQPAYAPFAASNAWGPTSITITANTAAGFSYLFWWVSGLLVYFNERRNRYVRFHAVQSIMLTGVLSIFSVLAYIIAALFNDVFLNTHQRIWQTLSIGTVVLAALLVLLPWLTAMVAAWSGTYLRLPIVGDYAERYASPPFEPRSGASNR